MTAHPGDRLGHYRLLEFIGEGGMRSVWKAHDTRLERVVALKLLPEALGADANRFARFDLEARALAALSHPAIVTLYALEEAQGRHFLSMEYVEGTPLSRMVPEGGLPLGVFFDLALPLVDAVRAAHARGVTHRDLKPANILVTASGHVKVLDFGLARVLTDPARPLGERTTLVATHADELVGTPQFMSPEQVLGRPVDHRSDLFSLGAVLYVMLTARLPFPGDTVAEVIAAVLRDAPPPVGAVRPGTPAALGRLVARCLEKDPLDRFQQADEVYAALEAARDDTAAEPAALVRSVAVLPFDDLSPEKDQDYFCEGIAEEIILALSQVKSLRVAPRSASFLARAAMREGRDIGRRLGVDTLLEGSVRKSGTRVRISVELADVVGGYHLWTARYDREMHDIFALQDEIASRVAEALQGPLGLRGRPLAARASTIQIQAYDFYLRGRKFYYQFSRKGMEFALGMFGRAIDLDPGYARAYAGVADCHAFLYLYAGRHDADRNAADAASRRAVELAPESAEAHASRGVALSLLQALDEAEAEFKQALRVNPDLYEAYYFYARTCFAAGRLDQAVALYEKASELRPDDYQAPLLVAQIHEDRGRSGDAERCRRRGVAIADEHLRLCPDDVRALYMGANGLVALGEREQGLDWARRALALDPDEPMLLYNIGCIYSLAGLTGEALDCLERSVEKGLTQTGWFLHDSNLDPLRSHPRFVRLMAALQNAASS